MPVHDDRQKVLDATDIVRLVGEQVALRPKGREFVGLCPFHDDKSPSMYVSPAKQIYKCFSCGAGGTCFDFVMNYHKMTFPEALKHLAERAGVELTPWKGSRSDGSEGPSDRELIRDANDKALGFYRSLLKHAEHGKVARDYIDKRGISPEMVGDFQLGVAPDRWDGLAQMVAAKGWDIRGFIAAGLLTPRGSAQQAQASSIRPQDCYDRLRHRLIFPIFDAIGRAIAFGGRELPNPVETAPKGDDSGSAKYLNSPETKLFNKSATLYGIHVAKKPIIDSRTAVVVEGYTDVIACHQAGERNVVATLGTALTREHVTELRRYCEKVIVIFDADEAGQKAADRAVEVFLTGELDVAVAALPGGLDPADLFAEEDGPQRWKSAMDAAQDALAYQLARFRERLDAADTVTGRQRAAEGYIRRLAELGLARTTAIRRGFVVKRLSELLGIEEATINTLIRQHAPRPRPAPPRAPDPEPDEQAAQASLVESSPFDDPSGDGGEGAAQHAHALAVAERQVIGALIQDNRLFHSVLEDGGAFDEALVPGDMSVPAHRQLFKLIHDRLAEGRGVTLTGLASELTADGLSELVTVLTRADDEADHGSLGKQEKLYEMFRLAVKRIRSGLAEKDYRRVRQELGERLAHAENDVTVNAAALTEARQRLAASPTPGRILRRR